MSPIEWLNQRAPGFQHLSQPEKDATMHFALLWSLFEAKALNTNANASAILSLVHEWREQGRLDASNFSDQLAHFKSCYFSDGQPTHHFHSLDRKSIRQNSSHQCASRMPSSARKNTKNHKPPIA